jgi:citrate synthase
MVKDLIIKFHKDLGVEDPLFSIACALEEAALKDEYFVKRNLYPNINYWSCILLRQL